MDGWLAQNDRSAQTATTFIVHSHSHSHSAVDEVGSCTSIVAIVEADSLRLRHVVHKVRIGVNVYYVSKTPTGADQSRFSVNPTSGTSRQRQHLSLVEIDIVHLIHSVLLAWSTLLPG